MDEHRKHDRVSEPIRIDYRIISLGDKPHRHLEFSGFADMENISEGGMLFLHTDDIPVSTMIEMSFYLEDIDPLFLKGKVVRCKELQFRKYEIGIEFLPAFTKDHEILLHHIDLHRKRQS